MGTLSVTKYTHVFDNSLKDNEMLSKWCGGKFPWMETSCAMYGLDSMRLLVCYYNVGLVCTLWDPLHPMTHFVPIRPVMVFMAKVLLKRIQGFVPSLPRPSFEY